MIDSKNTSQYRNGDAGPFASTPSDVGLTYAAALGRANATVGAPDPHAESRNGDRQPPAPLGLFADKARTTIERVRAAALKKLSDWEGYWFAVEDRLASAVQRSEALSLELDVTPPGRRRALAEWRFTAITAALAVGLVFETYLTDIALEFVNVPEWERRLIAFGIALGLTLVAMVASHESRSRHWRRNAALWLAVTLVGALTILRYGVLSEDTAAWEVAGATVVLGAAAAVYAIWAAFVEGRVELAVRENEQSQHYGKLERTAADAREKADQIQELKNRLPAIVQGTADEAVGEIRGAPAQAAVEMSEYWVEYQQENAPAAPDIRGERDRLLAALAADVAGATDVIVRRATDLRLRIRPELSRRPKPPPPERMKEKSHV